MDKNFYYCTVTIQAPDHLENRITFAIATSANQANGLARRDVQATLPEGWAIVDSIAGAIKRDMLEHVAEEVLGWIRPPEPESEIDN